MRRLFRYFSHLQEVKESHISYFRSILPSTSIETQDLEHYTTDWLKIHKGLSKLVLKPTTTDQIAEILKYCNLERLGLVPQSGNTSQVGGAVPVQNEIILSMKNLNKILDFDEVQGIVWCDAGVILENLMHFANEKGWMVPLDLGAKGSCMIGGNVATNAGGLRYIRYGSMNGNVLGLEAVIPSGEILSDLKALRKDNTGLNLKQLFIGSEGILGVITKVALLLAPKPSSVHVAFLGCTSYEKVVKALTLAKNSLGEILSAFEFIDSPSMEIILKQTPRTRKPLTSPHNFYILIETSGSHFESDKAKMEHFLESAVESDLISDGVVAQDTSQSENFWRIREGGLLALRKEAVELHQFDFSLRIPEMYNFVEVVREKVGNAGRVTAYGHVGDGNLHLYVLGDGKNNLENVIYPFLYEEIKRRNGSISAEHGIGLFKQGLIGYTKSETNIKYMVRNI